VKVTIDRIRCSGHGICEALSDIFEVDADGKSTVKTDTIPPTEQAAVTEAIACCPTGALRMTGEV
jgi:ferredoxin